MCVLECEVEYDTTEGYRCYADNIATLAIWKSKAKANPIFLNKTSSILKLHQWPSINASYSWNIKNYGKSLSFPFRKKKNFFLLWADLSLELVAVRATACNRLHTGSCTDRPNTKQLSKCVGRGWARSRVSSRARHPSKLQAIPLKWWNPSLKMTLIRPMPLQAEEARNHIWLTPA